MTFLGGIFGGRNTVFVIINGNLNAQGDVDNVVWPVGVFFLEQHTGCLMHGNARPHTVRLIQVFLARHDVNVLPRPACSPEMNPIEHLRDLLGRKARTNHAIHIITDLTAARVHEWNAIPADVVRRYVRPMRPRTFALFCRIDFNVPTLQKTSHQFRNEGTLYLCEF